MRFRDMQHHLLLHADLLEQFHPQASESLRATARQLQITINYFENEKWMAILAFRSLLQDHLRRDGRLPTVDAWHYEHPQRKVGWTRSQRLDLCHQWLHPSERTMELQWHIQTSVAQLLANDNPLNTLHQHLQTFAAPTSAHECVPVHRFDVTPFRLFQAHSDALRALAGHSLATLFLAWFHVHHKDKTRRQMEVNSKLARRHKLQQVYEAADRAAQARDPFRLYQAIKSLTPKQAYKRIILRGENGDVLSPEQAADRSYPYINTF
eukprot:s1398_g1.t1